MKKYMTKADVGREIESQNYHVITEFLKGLPCTMIGKKPKWKREDVMKRLYEQEKTLCDGRGQDT